MGSSGQRDAIPGAGPADDVLVERMRGGDAEAFGQLFERYTRMLQSYMRRWVPTAVLRKISTADILQEVRIVAFSGAPNFENRGEGAIRNWLLKILQLKVREVLRTYAGTKMRDVGREVSRPLRSDTAQFTARGPSPSEAAVGSELAEHAECALRSLPAHYQEVLRLVREEQLTLREAAARMDRTHEGTKKLYGRAVARFAEEFGRLRGESHG